jgi:transposase InsO family protein
MKLSKTETTLSAAALKAGMTEKTARKWRQRGQSPSETKTPRTYRTRSDPFAGVWGELEPFLLCDPSVEALTLFEYLTRTYPDEFQASQVRTLQRRVKLWRLEHGAEREVFFPQIHFPGRQGQSDFTSMNEVNVTLAGQPFAHLLYHFTLTYSNWEWGLVCATESYESLAQGLQTALWELGGVPVEHRTDSLSAAVTPRQTKMEFTEKYQGLLRHYGLQASHTNPGCGHENGDVEQSHYRFKQAVKQELLLRGSRDFASRAAYEEFLRRLFQRRNHLRRERVTADVLALRALPERRLEAFTSERHRVTKASSIQVRGNFYSVPSQWIGEWVEVRVSGEQLEVWLGGKCCQRMARLRGQGQAQINDRHIIHSLVRKPGAFQHYQYQPSLFPRSVFRLVWDALQAQYAQTRTNEAEREYLNILYLAAQESEELVAQVLQELVAKEQVVTSHDVRAQVAARRSEALCSVPGVFLPLLELSAYDGLLGEVTA